jgi:hypothetical protein
VNGLNDANGHDVRKTVIALPRRRGDALNVGDVHQPPNGLLLLPNA